MAEAVSNRGILKVYGSTFDKHYVWDSELRKSVTHQCNRFKCQIKQITTLQPINHRKQNEYLSIYIYIMHIYQYTCGGVKAKRENIRSDKRIGRLGEGSAQEDGKREALCLLWHPRLAVNSSRY